MWTVGQLVAICQAWDGRWRILKPSLEMGKPDSSMTRQYHFVATPLPVAVMRIPPLRARTLKIETDGGPEPLR